MTVVAGALGYARSLKISVHPDHNGRHGHCFSVDTGPGEMESARIVCGDPQDLPEIGGFLGNGILVEIKDDQTMDIVSSICGAPLLYRRTIAGRTAFATNLELLTDESSARLELDWDTVTRMAASGRPAPGRTLFRGIEIVAPGTRLHVSRDGAISEVGRFEPPDLCFDSPEEYLQAQRDAFRTAMKRMCLDGAFLSLTAGLDTRAILAVIMEQGRPIDAVTIGGVHPSIDVLRAGELARACGLEHRVVRLDQAYRQNLPSLCESVSWRTGGMSSFSQAPDQWLYQQIGDRYSARISGNLGNQVGRGGTEGVSLRGARLDVLAGDGTGLPRAVAGEHWMHDAAGEERVDSPRFLIQVENLCSSLPNYALGYSLCRQQTPYADRDLISLKMCEPQSTNRQSLTAMRLSDLKHRFTGAPVERSFQRKLIVETGGFVSKCPVNWGWRPRGGIAPAAALLGLGAFADLALGVIGKRIPVVNRTRFALGVAGLAEFERREHFYHGPMPEFVRDSVLSRSVRESGVLAMDFVEPLVTDGFYDRRNFATIDFVLDLALAVRKFL